MTCADQIHARTTASAIARLAAGLVSVGLLFAAVKVAADGPVSASEQVAARSTDRLVERGRYLVQIGGCNDCHTAGYPQSSGQLPVSEWLTGSQVGFRGAWGTSYPSNLRVTVSTLTEAQWLEFARVERLPPMPWFNLRDMSDADLKAIYHFIRALGPKGERAPAAVAPGSTVATPFIVFEPRSDELVSGVTAAR
ncbi:MAG: cytochrome c precursor [Steroidobacteraceae bacterium]